MARSERVGGWLFWQSSKCLATQVEPEPSDYAPGDSEPCVSCCDLKCVAVLVRGTPVVEVVGSSPFGGSS